jgi:hypothetical protein
MSGLRRAVGKIAVVIGVIVILVVAIASYEVLVSKAPGGTTTTVVPPPTNTTTSTVPLNTTTYVTSGYYEVYNTTATFNNSTSGWLVILTGLVGGWDRPVNITDVRALTPSGPVYNFSWAGVSPIGSSLVPTSPLTVNSNESFEIDVFISMAQGFAHNEVAAIAGYESGLGSKVSTVTVTTTETVTAPVNVASFAYAPYVGSNGFTTVNPGGPTYELTLQNEAGYPLTSLSATLENLSAFLPNSVLTYQFKVSSSHPLGQGEKVSDIEGIIGPTATGPYTLVIDGTIQGQSTPFIETVTVTIGS